MQSLFGEKVNHIDVYKSNYVKRNTEYLWLYASTEFSFKRPIFSPVIQTGIILLTSRLRARNNFCNI